MQDERRSKSFYCWGPQVSSLFEQIFRGVQYIMQWLGYPGIFLLMLVENLFPPIPSEVVMTFGGALVAEDRMNFAWVMLAGTLGSGVGAIILYYVGYRMGHERLERFVCRYGKYMFLSAREIQKGLDLFQRHGYSTVLLARLVPGVRSLISIPAGVNRMPFWPFLGLTLLGTLAWNLLLAGAGYVMGRNWTRVLELLDTYENVLLVALAGLVLYGLVRKFQARGTVSVRSGCE